MNREYHKWYSRALQRDMELLIFGHSGTPVLVFPSSMGRFYEYESRGMIEVVRDRYEHGALQAFCVDSVDKESWYNWGAHPGYRAYRQTEYDRYLMDDVVPLIRSRNQSDKLLTTGCSFGGYHALNFALRHPDVVRGSVSLSGKFDIRNFVHGYYDENVYFNCPTDYVPNIQGGYLLDQIRRQRIVLGTSYDDICLGANRYMSRLMAGKNIPHWLDTWNDGLKHDWPLWQGQTVKHLTP